jgi:NAD(P)-dependent dehydrogenase (short-subunit alcohol dehydrogenase family)
MRLESKVALVTGAGSGIGRALALRLAQGGARAVAVSDIDEAGLAETAEQLGRAGVEVHQQRLDVGDREAVFAWAAAVVERFGVAHQIYNNAGIAFSRPVIESEWEDYERVLRVNLHGVIHGTQAFLPHLIASSDGHVVNISSLNGILAQEKMSHYCASKFAVRGFTESLRIEMITAGHRVGVTSVHPGGIKTKIADHAFADAKRRGLPITAEDERRRRIYNEKLLKMDPATAAQIIVSGVERGKGRVMVGNDARFLDAVVRAIPALYPRAVVAGSKRLMG